MNSNLWVGMSLFSPGQSGQNGTKEWKLILPPNTDVRWLNQVKRPVTLPLISQQKRPDLTLISRRKIFGGQSDNINSDLLL
jgi:hypothetical protein